MRALEGVWAALPRAKAARLLRALLDLFDKDAAGDRAARQRVQMQLCIDLVAWSVRDKRVFLKQSLDLRLAGLYARPPIAHARP